MTGPREPDAVTAVAPSRLRTLIRAAASEVLGLFVDDVVLSVGVLVILGVGWGVVSATGGGGYLVAAALAVWCAAVSMWEGVRTRPASRVVLDSECGRVPDRDPGDSPPSGEAAR